MDLEKASKIVNCKKQIENNNKLLLKITKENEILFSSLILMLGTLPEELKARYDEELASDNWKKYSKTYPLYNEK